MYHPPDTTTQSAPSRPALGRYGARASASAPLADLQVYQPGSALALAILMLPVALAVGAAALALQVAHAVPLWLPLLALLGLPAAPLVWLLLQSARTTATGIAVARPWRTWTQLHWDEIQHVTQRGLVMRISSDGETLVLAPRLLRQGARLRRQILLRLPPHTLSVRLSREAEDIVSSAITMQPDGSVAGAVVGRPRARYSAVLLLMAGTLGVVAGLVVSGTAATTALRTGVAGIAALLALFFLISAIWLLQRLSVDERGITITRAVGFPRRQFFAWQRISMLEHTPHLALLRIRDDHVRTLCAGPQLFDSERGAVLWALIQSHGGDHAAHQVLIIRRRRLPS